MSNPYGPPYGKPVPAQPTHVQVTDTYGNTFFVDASTLQSNGQPTWGQPPYFPPPTSAPQNWLLRIWKNRFQRQILLTVMVIIIVAFSWQFLWDTTFKLIMLAIGLSIIAKVSPFKKGKRKMHL